MGVHFGLYLLNERDSHGQLYGILKLIYRGKECHIESFENLVRLGFIAILKIGHFTTINPWLMIHLRLYLPNAQDSHELVCAILKLIYRGLKRRIASFVNLVRLGATAFLKSRIFFGIWSYSV